MCDFVVFLVGWMEGVVGLAGWLREGLYRNIVARRVSIRGFIFFSYLPACSSRRRL